MNFYKLEWIYSLAKELKFNHDEIRRLVKLDEIGDKRRKNTSRKNKKPRRYIFSYNVGGWTSEEIKGKETGKG